MARDLTRARAQKLAKADKPHERKDRKKLEALRIRLYDRLAEPGELEFFYDAARDLSQSGEGMFIELIRSQAYLEADKDERRHLVQALTIAAQRRAASGEMIRFMLARILPEYRGSELITDQPPQSKAPPIFINVNGRGTVEAREGYDEKNRALKAVRVTAEPGEEDELEEAGV